MNQVILTPNHLAAALGLKREDLNHLIRSVPDFYYTFSEPKLNKETGEPKLKDGEIQYRSYNASTGTLRKVQDRLLKSILQKIPLLPCLKGGMKGQSGAINANIHKGQIFRFQTDITNFFPSVSSEMVCYALRDKGFSKQVANIITDLTTLSTTKSFHNRSLPQGAPTSPILSNIVFERIAKQLGDVVADKDIKFTTWIDDLTFSSNKDFRDLIPSLIQIISKNGFKISRKKTTYRHNTSIITGVVTGMSTLKVTDTFRNKDEGGLNEMQKLGRQAYKEYVHRIDKGK